MEEIWKTIPGFKRYEASSLGNVRTLNWKNSGRIVVIKPALSKKGYLGSMFLNDEGVSKNMKIHRLVAFAFHGISELTVNHKDHIKTNNRPNNLEYMTALENSKEAQNAGLQIILRGERNGFSILKENQVLEIREKYVPFVYTRQMLADEYGVKKATIKNVLSGRSWGWLK